LGERAKHSSKWRFNLVHTERKNDDMDLALKGKRALVTGSTRGIGEAIVRRLAAEGARVVVHCRNSAEADPLLNALRAEGADAALALGDLNTDAEADHVVSQALEAFEGVDILVNNAGRFFGKPWAETEPAEWNSIYNNNVTSMVRMSRRLAPLMAERQWGRVINIASTIGLMPDVNMAAYAATKAALHNLTVALSRDLGTRGVTVNAISPGLTNSAGVQDLLQMMVEGHGWPSEPGQLEQKAVSAWAPNPVGRMGRVEEVASLVAFVASPRADYINGNNLRIDGGLDPTIS
jgi:NAD(P)-dependent dehydrogenase (short-subunit alcohol dehydrogenase family)